MIYSINKNFFFEKYPFLDNEICKKKLYKLYYVIKSQLIIPLTIVVLFNSVPFNDIVSISLYSIFIFNLIRLNNKDLRFFYRNDFRLTITDDRKRLLANMIGIFIMREVVESNLIFRILLLYFLTNITCLEIILFTLTYIGFYIFILSVYFILENSTHSIKRVFSFLNYIFSFTIFTGIFYCLIKIILKVFQNGIHNVLSGDKFFENLFEIYYCYRDKVVYMYETQRYAIFIGSIILYILVYILCNISIKIYHKYYYEQFSNNIDKLKFISFCEKLFCYSPQNDIDILVKKEYSLLKYMYRYNFKDYFFNILFDRTFGVLVILYLINIEFTDSIKYLPFFIGVPIILILYTMSQMNAKMLSNMSFVSDFNTIRLALSNGIDIKKIIKSKLQFYFQIKSISILLILCFINFAYIKLQVPIGLIIVGNILNVIILWRVSKIAFINNIIYCRMNYIGIEQFIEETNILEEGTDDFVAFDIFYTISATLYILSIIFTAVIPIIDGKIVMILFISVMVVGLISLDILMNKILKNIIRFIEQGQLTLDFTKIFKRLSIRRK